MLEFNCYSLTCMLQVIKAIFLSCYIIEPILFKLISLCALKIICVIPWTLSIVKILTTLLWAKRATNQIMKVFFSLLYWTNETNSQLACTNFLFLLFFFELNWTKNFTNFLMLPCISNNSPKLEPYSWLTIICSLKLKVR